MNPFIESSAADSSRMLARAAVRLPTSLRGAWHRLSMLGSLAILLAFPWVTSTGCEGKSDPTTWSGYELLHDGIAHDGVLGLGPLALIVSALLIFGIARLQKLPAPKPRFFLHVLGFLLSAGGVGATGIAMAMPTVADVVTEHAAWALGTAAMLAFFADAAVRVFLGAREWRRDVVARRATGGITAPPAARVSRFTAPV